MTTSEATDGALTATVLEGDVLFSVLLAAHDGSVLARAAAVAVSWRRMITENAEHLWRQLLQADFPFLDADRQRQALDVYRNRYSTEFVVDVLNSYVLRPGVFGSAPGISMRYMRPGVLYPSAETRSPHVGEIPAARARLPCAHDVIDGVDEAHRFPLDSYRRLRPGQLVELQWKKRTDSPRFVWWAALVHAVPSDDTVALFFPQCRIQCLASR